MKLNIPNKLTILRILMTPVFLLCLLARFEHHYLVALLLFLAASATDWIDGYLARKHGAVTDFGKFLDPLADKMLTTGALLGFIELEIGAGVVWVVFIVLLREFLVTSFRLVAVEKGRVIAANIWGKVKTVSQMAAIIACIFFEYLFTLSAIPFSPETICYIRAGYSCLLWISAVLAVVSGVIYIFENIRYIDQKK